MRLFQWHVIAIPSNPTVLHDVLLAIHLPHRIGRDPAMITKTFS
jgi:hypothetical protein